MRENTVKRRLREGKPSVGTWLSIPSPYTSEVMAQAGYDWLVIDMEHNPMSVETVGLMISSMFPTRTVPLVRIPWNTGENIKRVLDMGAWGIVVPMVNSKEEAEQAVREAKYYPLGRRSIGGRRHAVGFATDASTYFEKANEQIVVIVQIEHIEAVRNIDDIVSVPGIDAIFIGPNDLMSSMGLKPSLESADPSVAAAIETVKQSARRHGVPTGIHVANPQVANQRIAEGFQFIAIASEVAGMLGKALSDIAQLEESALESKSSVKEVRY
ncbi:HpcH/HpaI aldolase family protein [Paenibacillus thalictri]|uniref:2-dehydro-3-deoxyglucarate aldolase n=1 Tax=Paenibacillus thalictri TaxID=2527873 RepID=A0A4Q9DTP2_9BACL|nr:aldolase/citrate lyase family protein [Paenibacillus thalictri]TBL77858.1 2-dehydro-3-deoxyglucarate aldolase [Paenibacillus thalictri]